MICLVNKINLVITITGFIMETPKGKKFYGSVTISERGQIVIPADARKDFSINAGDKLLVFGDLEQGIGISTFSIMQRTMKGTANLFHEIGSMMEDTKTKKPKKNTKAKDNKK